MRHAKPVVLQRRALACCIAAALAPTAYAGPEGAQIVAGAGAITQTDAATTLITQSSDRLAIDWQSFNVGVNETVRFEQPSAQAAALNRIFDQNPSSILGAVEANGRVYLLNPNGMVFGATARINVGALIASSLNLNVDDFVAGRQNFEAGSTGAGLVLNRGVITAATGGSVTLLGGAVANEGLIVADLGQVTLGAGNRARLDFDGDGLLYFEVDDAVVANSAGTAAAVSSSGEIRADGGQVLLTARAAQDVFSEVVNNTGLIRAARIDASGGVVRLLGSGGAVVTTGAIDARGASAADAGGRVEVLGDRVGVLGSASIDVSGRSGGSIFVGGDHRGGGDVTSASTVIASDVTLSADARANGDGGDIVVWADKGTWFRGTASARGGELGGDGGFVEISSKDALVFSGDVDTRAPNGALGMLLFDPSTITIIDGAGPGADDNDLNDGNISNNGGNDTTPFTISEQKLESVAANTNIRLEAAGSITMQDLADNVLGLATDSGQGITIVADENNNGSGSFTMDASDTIRTEGGDVTIRGAGLTIGNINVRGAGGAATGGAITLTSSTGATISGNLTAADEIEISIDTNDDEVATLTVGGTLTAGSGHLTGGDDNNDILEGSDAAGDAFVGNAGNDGSLNGLAFVDFGTLSGRGGDDTFTFSGDFTSALGGDGNDIFTVNGSAQLATVDGGAGFDTLERPAGGTNTWVVNTLGTGTANGDDFIGFENLTGGTGADTFTFNAPVTGAIRGGAGNDTFTVNGVTLGSIDGEADNDTVTLVGAAASVGSLSGGFGGATDSDTLVSCACSNAWHVNALDQGTLNASAFTEFENLTGGSGADDFVITAMVTGTVRGGAGNDTFSVSGVNLGSLDGGADSDAVQLGLGATVGTLTGGAGGSDNDTLAVAGGANVWTVTAQDQGTLNGAAFTEFENLVGGSGADTFTLSASLTGALAGGGGNDTLASGGGTNTWLVTALDAGTLNARPFSEIENLAGGGGADAFTFTAPVSGTVTGGAGNDTFAVNGVTLASLDAGADADTVTLGAGGAVTTLSGGVGGNDNDTLAATTGTNTWSVTSTDAGVLNASAFTEFENLTGGSGADDFVITAMVTGTVRGGAGNDTFSVSGVNLGSLDGGADSDAVQLGLGATVGTLTGGAGGSDNDTLAVAGGANVWTVTAQDQGTLNGAAFTEFENLVGGSGADTFTLSASLTGALAGGGGNDTLASGGGTNTWLVTALDAGTLNARPFSEIENLAGGGGADAFTFTAPVSGTVTGGAGNDTFAVNGVTLASLDAGADADTVTLGAGGAVTTLSGGVGGNDNDTLAATTGTNTWSVTSTDTGVLNANFFTEFENLTGGNGADSFAFIGALTGTASGGAGDDTFNVLAGSVGAVNGGANNDTLSYAGSVTPRTFTIAALAANSIENIIGSSSGADVLQGTSGNDAFTTMGFDAGTVGALTYSSFESLEGLAGSDTFTLQHAVTGTVDGGDDADTFIVGAGAVGGIIVGGAGADTLQQSSGTATFTVTAANGGTLNALSFSTVENLTGSPGNDVFTFNAALTGTASGGAGDDTFALNNGGSAGLIDGGAGSDTQTYAGLTGPITVTVGGLTSIENLVGSSDGGDTLVGTAAPDTFATTGANAGTVNGFTYASFENLQGAGGADQFTLSHSSAGVVDGGAGDDTFTLLAAITGQIVGGSGADRFEVRANTSAELAGGDGDDVYAIADGVVTAGILDGAAGRDVLDLTAYRSARSVVLTGAGTIDGFNGSDASVATFRNIEAITADPASGSSLRGRDADATWNVDGSGNLYTSGGLNLAFAGFASLTGGSAADRFRLNAGSVPNGLTINGGAGNDLLETVGNMNVGGTLAVAAVETITNPSSAVLTANALTIDGATGGTGTAAAPLLVQLATLDVLHSDGGLFVVDRTGDLRVTNAQLGTGNAKIVVDQGNLVVGLIDVGGMGSASTPPAPGVGGNVELVALQGSILDGGSAVNVRARSATLRARLNVGASADPITIVVPSDETITLSAVNATIDNPSLAKVDDTLVAGVFSDVTATATAAAVGAGAASSVLDVAAIDWVGLDPNVTLVDCTDPCVLLPADQREDDGFALLRDATKLLVLRDGDRLALVPVAEAKSER